MPHDVQMFTTQRSRDVAAVPVLALALLLPALFNRFPLIFPDTGTYLHIAFDQAYALDRSSIYGFFLKPMVSALSGTAGLWLAIVAQVLLVALVLWGAARALVPGRAVPPLLLLTAAITSVGFHAAQLMPDAFTGAAILLAWMATARDPGEPGAPLLWVATTAAALMHYTHIPLVALSAIAALAAQKLLGLAWRSLGRRAIAAAASVVIAAIVQISLNYSALHQAKVAPFGPLFLYARLNEDGLIKPWLERHCGRDAPQRLCTLAPGLPKDSQQLLWSDTTPIRRLVWQGEATRWQIVADMRAANRGAISEAPLEFARSSLGGTLSQFLHFAPLDDECPANCHLRKSGIGYTLNRYRASVLPALDASRQVTDTMPKRLIRAIMVPVAALALLLLPLAGWAAWRRRDPAALSLVVSVATALVLNAALAGALSDVHDRYQSRIVWLAPFALLALAIRWQVWDLVRDRPWRFGGRVPPEAVPVES